MIKPDNSLPRSWFWAQYGSVFSAKISQEATGCMDACEGFVPWIRSPGEGNFNMYWPLGVNQCGTTRPYNEWRLISNYPKPYNAYRAELTVFRADGRTIPYFTQVWEDPLKRALPEGCIVWKPHISTPSGVYPIQLKLTNCNGDYILINSNGIIPDVTVVCGGGNIVSVEDRQFGFQNVDSLSMDNRIKGNSQKITPPSVELVNYSVLPIISLTAFPNPTTGKVTIQTNSDIGKSVIKITNILGKDEASFHNDALLKNSTHEYDMSNLPSGMYIISIISDNKIICRTKINKL